MAEVGIPKLVFDKNAGVVLRNAGNDVRSIGSNAHLSVLALQLDPQHRGQSVEVCREPRGEVLGFMAPCLSNVHRFQRAKLSCFTHL